MSTTTATPSPSRLWLYFQETHGIALTASEESDIRHAANAAAESDIRTLEAELVAERERVRVLRGASVFIIKCGGMNIDTELGEIRCNGSWCAEQARAALAATQEARK